MKRTFALALATCAVIATGCAAQQVPTVGGGPSASSPSVPSLVRSSDSSARVTPGAPSSMGISPTTTPTSATSPSGSPSSAAGFLRLARTVYPAKSIATLEQNGRAICSSLRKNASVHDEVNTLAGQLHSQAMANQVVQAAIGAYCPDLKR